MKVGEYREKLVRNVRELRTVGGEVFPIGTIFRVTTVWRGRLNMHVHPHRLVTNAGDTYSYAPGIRKVHPRDVALVEAPSTTKSSGPKP